MSWTFSLKGQIDCCYSGKYLTLNVSDRQSVLTLWRLWPELPMAEVYIWTYVVFWKWSVHGQCVSWCLDSKEYYFISNSVSYSMIYGRHRVERKCILYKSAKMPMVLELVACITCIFACIAKDWSSFVTVLQHEGKLTICTWRFVIKQKQKCNGIF